MGLADTLRRWLGRAREEASDLSERAGPVIEKAAEKAKETSLDVLEKAVPVMEKAVEKAKDVLGERDGAGDRTESSRPAGEAGSEPEVSDQASAGTAEGARGGTEAADVSGEPEPGAEEAPERSPGNVVESGEGDDTPD